jgi:hypothetical protein
VERQGVFFPTFTRRFRPTFHVYIRQKSGI